MTDDAPLWILQERARGTRLAANRARAAFVHRVSDAQGTIGEQALLIRATDRDLCISYADHVATAAENELLTAAQALLDKDPTLSAEMRAAVHEVFASRVPAMRAAALHLALNLEDR